MQQQQPLINYNINVKVKVKSKSKSKTFNYASQPSTSPPAYEEICQPLISEKDGDQQKTFLSKRDLLLKTAAVLWMLVLIYISLG